MHDLIGTDVDQALDLARGAVADGAWALVVCGGDGMVHLGVNLVAGTDVPLGIIAAGTGNDNARELGLPVRDAAGLHVLAVQHEGNEDPHNLSWLDYQDFKDKSGAFADLAAYDVNFVGLSADNRAERITVSYVTSNYFSMLGVPPAVGRVDGEVAEHQRRVVAQRHSQLGAPHHPSGVVDGGDVAAVHARRRLAGPAGRHGPGVVVVTHPVDRAVDEDLVPRPGEVGPGRVEGAHGDDADHARHCPLLRFAAATD